MSDEATPDRVAQTGRSTCYFCPSEGPLKRHHILPKRLGGTDSDRNLVELCPTCHVRLEQLYDDRVLTTLEADMSRDAVQWADHYDAAVIDELEVGATVSVAVLRKLYRTRTRIKNSETVRVRVKQLVESGLFERAGGSRSYRFVGKEEG